MCLLLCCLAVASVTASFGQAQRKDANKDPYELPGIQPSASDPEMEWLDGPLTPDEFFESIARLLPKGNAKPFFDHVFRIVDSDNKGWIDNNDLLLVINIIKAGELEEKAELMFKFYDVDRSGSIEPRDVAEIIRAMRDMVEPSLASQDQSNIIETGTRENFARMDENIDGVLSKDEFIRGCLANEIIRQFLDVDAEKVFDSSRGIEDFYKDLHEVLGIQRSATDSEVDSHDGQLTPEEYLDPIASFFPEDNAKSFSEHVFRTIDSKNTGKIDLNDFLLVINIINDGKPEEKLGWSFQLYDVNGNGTIEPSEMTGITRAIDDMVGPLVTTQDPSNTPERRTREIFAKIDENRDGVLSKNEVFEGCMTDEFIRLVLKTDARDRSEL